MFYVFFPGPPSSLESEVFRRTLEASAGVGRRQAAAAGEGAALFAVNFEARTARRLPWSVHRDLSLSFCCRVVLYPEDVAREMSHFCNKEYVIY